MITGASNNMFSITSPQEFQHVGTHHCIANDNTLLAVPWKTSNGKSPIVQLVNFFQRGISVYLERLIRLARNQVDRATTEEHNTEAYHMGEHRKEDQQLLID